MKVDLDRLFRASFAHTIEFTSEFPNIYMKLKAERYVKPDRRGGKAEKMQWSREYQIGWLLFEGAVEGLAESFGKEWEQAVHEAEKVG
jgi:hypothetical protein